VQEATEPVTPANLAEVHDAGSARCGAGRGALIKGAVGSMGVVVLGVDLHHTIEVAPAVASEAQGAL